MSWPLVKLGEIFDISSSKRVHQKDWRAEGVPFYRAREVVVLSRDGKVENDLFIEEEMYEEYKSKYGVPREGDLLVTAVGTLGRTYAVKKNDRFYFKDASVIWLSKKRDVDTSYVQHAMNSPEVQRFIQNSSGATVGTYTIGKATETEIPLPPLPEQKRIAAILDKADAIRRKRQQAIQLADEFLRAVFLDMFGDPVTNPKGLRKAPITELADVITGFAFKSDEYVSKSDESVRLCRGTNTLSGYFDWSDTAYWPKSKLDKLVGYLIREGDVILAMDRPWISTGLKICVFPENESPTYLVQRVARLRPKELWHSDYIYACINSQAFERHCCPTETTVPHISPVELKSFEILMPESKFLRKYHSIVSRLGGSIKNMFRGSEENQAIFNSLSQSAFEGKL